MCFSTVHLIIYLVWFLRLMMKLIICKHLYFLQLNLNLFQGQKYTVLLGCDASSSGSDCSSNDTQTLVLSQTTHTLTMVFEKKANKVLVQNVTFSYNLPEGPRGEIFVKISHF